MKKKTLPGTHPGFTCTKRHTNLTIYAFLRALEVFRSIKDSGPGPQSPKMKISKKMKKTPPGIHLFFKRVKFQTDFTIYAFSRASQRL